MASLKMFEKATARLLDAALECVLYGTGQLMFYIQVTAALHV
jgi:hypothetical protein